MALRIAKYCALLPVGQLVQTEVRVRVKYASFSVLMVLQMSGLLRVKEIFVSRVFVNVLRDRLHSRFLSPHRCRLLLVHEERFGVGAE